MSTSKRDPTTKPVQVPRSNQNNSNPRDNSKGTKSCDSSPQSRPTSNQESTPPKPADTTAGIGLRSPTESQTDRWTNEGGAPKEGSAATKRNPDHSKPAKPVTPAVKPTTTTVANSSGGGTTDAMGKASTTESGNQDDCCTTSSTSARPEDTKKSGDSRNEPMPQQHKASDVVSGEERKTGGVGTKPKSTKR